jgi:voltage-dependent calcium channel
MDSYTEPFILLLILFNAIVLITQSTRAVFLDTNPPPAGYFQTWEHYALFVLFILYT